MKLDRLIGILSVLLQRDTVTAPYLAGRFEVSRRTINRDIETLCQAGIPLVTRRGVNGGISIAQGYKLSHTLLTSREMEDILAGLRSLDSVNGTSQYKLLMEKLSAGSSDLLVGNQTVLIDLASWYQASLGPKIQLLRNAIDAGREVRFRYYAPKGESLRQVEPYFLLFHWASWYLWGWCGQREDFRLFKLNRMDGLEETGRTFPRRQVPLPDLSNQRIFPGGIRVKALFQPGCKWRLVEEFGTGCFQTQEDGRLLFQADYPHREELITWLMTFRDQVELLEPRELRRELMEALDKIRNIYSREEGKS